MICKRGHELTPENTNTRGLCRECDATAVDRWAKNHPAAAAKARSAILRKDRHKERKAVFDAWHKKYCQGSEEAIQASALVRAALNRMRGVKP